jgi:hypothetical protein
MLFFFAFLEAVLSPTGDRIGSGVSSLSRKSAEKIKTTP